MKTLAVIPARYGSSRLSGKPLMDICTRPMIWWVYRQVAQAAGVDEVLVATDHEEIQRVCGQWGLPCRMTGANHQTSTNGSGRWRRLSRRMCISASTGTNP